MKPSKVIKIKRYTHHMQAPYKTATEKSIVEKDLI